MPDREFLAEKPANGLRVFVVGESSAAGYPYPPAYAFGAWLERRLQADLPDLSVEVVNAAVAGYSSRRALVALREVAGYQPDVVIVYSGHNEWAERRYYSRLIEMNPWLFRLRERFFSTRLFALTSHWLSPRRESSREALEHFVAGERQEQIEMFAVFSKRVEGRGLRHAGADRAARRALPAESRRDRADRAGGGRSRRLPHAHAEFRGLVARRVHPSAGSRGRGGGRVAGALRGGGARRRRRRLPGGARRLGPRARDR